MQKITTSEKICVLKSGIKGAGLGVYAIKNIKKGELIEKCPVVEVPENNLDNLNLTFLVTYLFYHGDNSAFIALGFGSLYNHSSSPNAVYKINPKEKTISFTALKVIKKDSEILVDYAPLVNKSIRPLWFE